MTHPNQSESNLSATAISAITSGNRLQAIKIIRAEQNIGLQEAINIINNWEKTASRIGQYPIPATPKSPTPTLTVDLNFVLNELSKTELDKLTLLYKFLQDETIFRDRISIDNAKNSFLVDITNNYDRREGFYRCIFYFKGKPIKFSVEPIKNNEGWSYKCSWRDWHNVSKTEAAEVNQSFICAFKVLYETKPADEIEPILTNNYHEEPNENTLFDFDLMIKFWFGQKRLHQLYQRARELENGKKTFLKWKFYWTKFNSPKPIEIDNKLIESLGLFLKNPKKKSVLYKNLDDYGGAGFSIDTINVLNWVRKNDRSTSNS